MKNAKSAPWVIGAALVAIVIGAVSWFLLVSPALDEASDFRDQTEAANSRNSILRIQNAELAKQFAKIEDLRAELAGYRTGIPEVIDQPGMTRTMSAIAESSGAFLLEATYPSSIGLMSATPIPDVATTPPAGLFAVPFEVKVLGSPEETFTFVDDLQKNAERLFYVASVDVVGQDESGSTGGRPATKDGDAEILVKGFVYVLDPDAGPTPAAGGGATNSSDDAVAN